MDRFGPGMVSFVGRLPSLWRLIMYYRVIESERLGPQSVSCIERFLLCSLCYWTTYFDIVSSVEDTGFSEESCTEGIVGVQEIGNWVCILHRHHIRWDGEGGGRGNGRIGGLWGPVIKGNVAVDGKLILANDYSQPIRELKNWSAMAVIVKGKVSSRISFYCSSYRPW